VATLIITIIIIIISSGDNSSYQPSNMDFSARFFLQIQLAENNFRLISSVANLCTVNKILLQQVDFCKVWLRIIFL